MSGALLKQKAILQQT